MVEIPNLTKGFYKERIENNLQELRSLQKNIGEMNKLREENSLDWEIEEMTRKIIFDENQLIESLKKEIENDREDLKKFG